MVLRAGSRLPAAETPPPEQGSARFRYRLGVIAIGLTGGIGAGKSTVADALVRRGAILIDSDRIVRELQEPGEPVFKAMVDRWGRRVVASDGRLDRAAVASIVFADEDELKAINDLVHPRVVEEMNTRRERLVDTDSIVIFDIPLLVRRDGTSTADRYDDLVGIIVVDMDPDLAIERLVEYRGFSEDDARNRIANQASRDDRRAVADIVIDNSGTRAELEIRIDEVWEWAQSLRSVTPTE